MKGKLLKGDFGKMRAKILIVLVLSAAMTLMPMAAYARFWRAFGTGLCVGLPLGCLLAPRTAAVVPPPPPPTTCYRVVPEHWETRWDPATQRNVTVYYPPVTAASPCP